MSSSSSYQPSHHPYIQIPPPPPPGPPPPAPPSGPPGSDPQFPHHHHYQQQQQYPPPQQNQWGPPPPPQHHPPYPAHHHPYPAPPPPPPPNYDWGNGSWTQHSGWEYPAAHSNQEDWAAKAKAWASARSAVENQHPHSTTRQEDPSPYANQYPQPQSATRQEDPSPYANQYPQPQSATRQEDPSPYANHYPQPKSATRQEDPSSYTNQYSQPQVATRQDPSPYANQYPQPVESHYQDVQPTLVPASDFAGYQGHMAPSHRSPAFRQQEPASVSSYTSESHFSFVTKDPVHGGNMSAGFAHHQGPINSSIYQQEVPSSYSSIPGNEDGLCRQQHGNSILPGDSRVMPKDHPQFSYENYSLDPMNRPLEFASRISHEIDHKMMGSYSDSPGPVKGADSGVGVSPLHSWIAPSAPGSSYPPFAPAFTSALQHDPVGVPPLPGQHSPLFGTGPGFGPPVPTHAGLTAGLAFHPPAAFPLDAYGGPLGSERPKKAAVPNWLREEIIKKAAIARSAPEQYKEGSQSAEDELIDKPIGTGDQEDSKSMDSAKSAEKDDDEDEEDAQRTAVINQEIKRVLTEVLLKVTDELFDEIATKVLSEDDPTVLPDSDNKFPDPMVFPPPVSTVEYSAKVTIPAKVMEPEEDASGETSSGSPVNLLGLSNYASDEDDEIQSSSIPKLDTDGARGATENGHLQKEAEEQKANKICAETDNNKGRPTRVHAEHGVAPSKLSDHSRSKDTANSNVILAYSETVSTVLVNERGDGDTVDVAKSTGHGRKETVNGPDVAVDKLLFRRSTSDDSKERSARRHDIGDGKKSSSRRDNNKETESNKAEKVETYSQRDERTKKKDNTEDSKRERVRDKKVRSPRHGEKARESSSSKRSPHRESKDIKYEREKGKNRHTKDDGDKKRGRSKEETNDKSRHRSSDAGRNKRRRSSSVGSRGKPIKESEIHSNSSSDEVSEDSRSKKHSERRNLSPSPVKSRRRQVSRSPHSKHIQRRHSPYSSLDDSRGRRSRSPVRRDRR